ncbi:5'-3' exonuclease [Salibacterium halotolerans]|uniref:5'-3' exonuclease n=1 Tax=Salibacterium halotolerans TaxID=1884432 RepID=A0A1I5MJG1_9BACI|nr:5'-3' exonuclease [Salibacterium halotolerans]SFP09633.1 5'-3' exonuclease [Salibacterium halotolerans]
MDHLFVVFPAHCTYKSAVCCIKSLLSKTHHLEDTAVYEINLEMISDMPKLVLSRSEKNSESYDVASHELPLSASAKAYRDSIQKLLGWVSANPTYELRFHINQMENAISFSTAKRQRQPQNVTPMKNRNERLILVDGSNILTTGYYATNSNAMQTVDGRPTNGVYIFVKRLIELLQRSKPSHVAVAWDEGRDTFRKRMYHDYKAQRKATEPQLKEQFSITQDFLTQIGIAQYSNPEIEADDVIGTLARMWEERTKQDCYIISNDKDLYQLVSGQTTQIVRKKNNYESITSDTIIQQHGVRPDQWADVKALLGDSSDNIPGVKGVGDKAAYPLIQNYETLDNLYKVLEELEQTDFKRYKKKLQEHRDTAFLSRDLALIEKYSEELFTPDFNEMKLQVTTNRLIESLELLQFYSIVKGLKQHA